MTWQTIDTAPRDGSEALYVIAPKASVYHIGPLGDERAIVVGSFADVSSDEPEDPFTVFVSLDGDDARYVATHWMPLPPLP